MGTIDDDDIEFGFDVRRLRQAIASGRIEHAKHTVAKNRRVETAMRSLRDEPEYRELAITLLGERLH